ncbi:hypothetical protein AAG906_003197 [Vitis piasezkii]
MAATWQPSNLSRVLQVRGINPYNPGLGYTAGTINHHLLEIGGLVCKKEAAGSAGENEGNFLLLSEAWSVRNRQQGVIGYVPLKLLFEFNKFLSAVSTIP